MIATAANSLRYLWILFCVNMRILKGTPTLDLSNGNTVVPDDGQAVIGTTTQCYSSLPTFTWEYVSTDGGFTPVLISGDPATAISGGSCGGGSSLYTGSVSVNYNYPVMFGQTAKLRLTVNNNPDLSSTSTGTLTFPAQYNLTGSSAMALLGQTFTWTCQMILPTNQTNKFVRFLRNETAVGIVGYNNGCKGANINSRYTYSCTSQTEFSLIIPQQNMTEREQNTIWRCAYISGSVAYSSVQKRLRIAIAVSSVSFEPSADPLTMTDGEQRTITCLVNENAFPTPTYRWFVGMRDVGVYTSFITVTGKKAESGMSLTCQATNNNKSMNASISLNVLYKPAVSTTTSSPYKVVEGQTATMTCSVTAANPNTDIRWSWIKTDSPSNVLHTGPTYTISNIQRGRSGNYSCRANNSIGTSPPATVQMDVQYKPEVSTTTSSPYKVVEGQTATMTCSVTAANPNTDIRWSWIKTDSPGNVHTGPTYTISNVQRGRSGTYSCRATNSIGTSTPASVQMDVQYGPALVMFSPDVITINETENQTVSPVSCSAVCNPNCTYRWTSVTTVNSGVLDLGVLKRTERGDYTCTASNTIKSISRTITVYVNYPPTTKVFQASGNRTYEESSRFSFTCKVDSYPFADINILNVDTGEVKALGGPLESLTYEESSAKCFHTGNYSCNSSNSYGSTSSVVQQIFVLCRPKHFDGQSHIDFGVKTNEGLNITAKFIGYPPPVLSWKFRKNLTDVNKTLSSEYQKSSVLLNASTVQTVLSKETLNEDEFGFYTVTATTPGKPSQNSIITYNVIPERKPNPPYNISTNCEVSRGTTIVSWVPGYDGGAEQTFLVSYRTNDNDERIITVSYKQPNATITGLNDDTLYYFKVIASNSNGKTLSEEEESCKTQVFIKSSKESSIGGIIGGTLGGVVFIIFIVLVFLNRKYQIKCHVSERMPNQSGSKLKASGSLSRFPGLGAEMSAQYEELNQNKREQENSYDAIRTTNSMENRISGAQYEELNQKRREQENSYDAIRTPNKNRMSGSTYEDLQPQKEENKYKKFTSPKDGKDSVYANSKILSQGNIYVNTSFKEN